MGSEKDRMSDPGDGEDIPSDFFDDFTKDDFMAGLSVIDSWDDEEKPNKRQDTRRINHETIDSVKDLRELIRDGRGDAKVEEPAVKFDDKYKWRKGESNQNRPSSSTSADDFIKPGSRRDPNKTNEAIKRDKEVKVKEYLAKHLESADNLRPPGTELDDYYDEDKPKEHRKTPKHFIEEKPAPVQRQVVFKERRYKEPPRHSSPRRYSPRRRHSPPPRWSPRRMSPRLHRRISPERGFRKRYSPPRRSPRRYSPRLRAHSPRRRRPSRSPQRNYELRRSRSPRSRSPLHTDTFLYPNDPHIPPIYPPENMPYQPPEPGPMYPPAQNEFPGGMSGYPYQQGAAYGTGFPDPYNYVPQLPAPSSAVPGPVPAPAPLAPVPNVVPTPAMVPAPTPPALEQKTPYDALAQLVAEGKISQEDYLKLAPNKGVSSSLDSKSISGVLTRCSQALTKLEKLLLPSHLMMNNHIIGAELKPLESKFSSPLKRQALVEFNFTKTNGPTIAQQNKQLVESIITTIGLEKVVSKYKKKLPKDMKDAAVQTTKPYCDVCEIRGSAKFEVGSTATEPEYFTTTVHTQVVEQDLINSKSVFNPSGSVSDGAPISIAHLTPAQLVSQLAARAKTLKQTSPAPPSVHQNQYGRRPYDYGGGRGGGSQHYHQNYNYRY